MEKIQNSNNSEDLRVIKPPLSLPDRFNLPTIFLAGSIEQGKAVDWQNDIIESFADSPAIFLNPRRDNWDPSWKQDAAEENFFNQVEWELDALERASAVAFYFQPGTLSPITLLELGLFAKSGKLAVCCPEGFWRKGNVDIVCQRYGVLQVETVDQLKDFIAEKIKTT